MIRAKLAGEYERIRIESGVLSKRLETIDRHDTWEDPLNYSLLIDHALNLLDSIVKAAVTAEVLFNRKD